MSRGHCLSGNVRDRGLEPPSLFPIKFITVDKERLAASYIKQTMLKRHQHLVSTRFVSTFELRLEPVATCFYLRYSVSYIQFELC